MDWEPIFRDLQAPAELDLPSRRTICRLPMARILTTQFQRAKTTNCCSPFRRVTETVWSENGERNSRSYRSLELVPSLNYLKTTNFYSVATFISNSPADTEALARRLAEDVGVGSVLALQGELGSGKTLFTKGFVAGMGSKAAVASPTFTIVHEYRDGQLPVYHFDFFRVESCQSLARL